MINRIFSLLNLEKRKIIYFSVLITEKLFVLSFHFFVVNYLSSESYGIFNQTNFISAFFQNILMFGVAIPFIVEVSKDYRLEKIFYNFFLPSSLIVSVLIFLIIIVFGEYFTIIIFGDPIFKNYLLILLIVIAADIFSEYIIVKHRVEDKLKYHSNFILFRTVIKISVLLMIFYLTDNFFLAFLISSISYLLLTLIISYLYFDLRPSNYYNLYQKNVYKIKSLFYEGFQFLIIYIIMTTSSILINLLIVKNFDISTLAIYNFNFMLASAPITILGYITFYALPDFSRLTSNSDDIMSSNIFKDLLFSSIIFLIFFVAIFSIYDIIISLINEFYADRFLFSLIFISNFVFMINNYLQFPLLSKKKYNNLIFITLISLSFNLVYLFFINKNFTILTPIYGFLIANIIAFILLLLNHISAYHK